MQPTTFDKQLSDSYTTVKNISFNVRLYFNNNLIYNKSKIHGLDIYKSPGKGYLGIPAKTHP